MWCAVYHLMVPINFVIFKVVMEYGIACLDCDEGSYIVCVMFNAINIVNLPLFCH